MHWLALMSTLVIMTRSGMCRIVPMRTNMTMKSLPHKATLEHRESLQNTTSGAMSRIGIKIRKTEPKAISG